MIFQRVYKYLASLLDVNVSQPTNGQPLVYESGSWVNSSTIKVEAINFTDGSTQTTATAFSTLSNTGFAQLD